MARTRLGVNVDHVATIRQARGGDSPDPVQAAMLAERAGADGITVHLREDRRHIQDRDLYKLRETVKTRLNLEMGLTPEIAAIALALRPNTVTLVPERRAELTTEGGLDAVAERKRIAEFALRCHQLGITVSLFIDPEPIQISAARDAGADAVELHTGTWCEQWRVPKVGERELARLTDAAAYTRECGLHLLAGHGLDYANIQEFMRCVLEVEEVNIGHSIVARAVFVGMERAVGEMRELLFWPQ